MPFKLQYSAHNRRHLILASDGKVYMKKTHENFGAVSVVDLTKN
jgi:putative transposon-encoded protein